MKNIKVHSVILARGGSKGIKNKNLYCVNSKPLIYWSIKQSLKSKIIKNTWVSSDSKKILDYSKRIGANIIERPSKYAKDNSSSEIAWLHAAKKLKDDADIILGIQPTSPIRDARDFDRALSKFKKYNYNSLFSAHKIKDFFVWEKYKSKFKSNYNYKKRPRRQEINDKFYENGSFYIFNTKEFLKYKCRLFKKIGVYEMEKIKSFQIDDLDDIVMINKLMKNYKII
jgi:CMP-N,N'-diacetyllegionaminic acid synthase